MMCGFHDSNCNGFGDMWWTDKCTYFSSIDVHNTSLFNMSTTHCYSTCPQHVIIRIVIQHIHNMLLFDMSTGCYSGAMWLALYVFFGGRVSNTTMQRFASPHERRT